MRDTANRLLRLLSLLQARSFCRGSELADQLGVTERTVRRDVDRLRELGYPVLASPGVGGGYQLGRGSVMPPLVLDDEEAVAVAVSLRTAAGGTVAGIGDAAMRAAAKLEQVLPTRLRQQISAVQGATDAMSAGTPVVDPATLLALAQACRDRLRTGFRYERHDGTVSDRRVEPYRLVSTGRRWYLVAFDREREAWRSFRVDRLHDVEATGPRFTPPDDPPDAVAFVTHGVSVAPYRHRVRVRLHVSVERAAEWIAPSTGSLVALDDEHCELTSGADSLEAIAVHLALLDCDFDILEPDELRVTLRTVAERLARAAAGSLPEDHP